MAQLKRELLDETPSTPGGRKLVGPDHYYDVGYRNGRNAGVRSAIALISQGDVRAGLRELAEVAP